MYCKRNIENTCMKVKATEGVGIYEIAYNPCPSQRLSYCNVYDGLLQPSNYKSECLPRSNQLLSYPGGKCSDNSDCRYGLCIDNICKDSEAYGPCFRDESCPIGTACVIDQFYKGVCLPLADEGFPCKKSTECKFNQICASSQCYPTYTRKDEEIITLFKDQMEEKVDVLCESGLAIEYDNKIMCASVTNIATNIDEQCLEDCQYKFKDIIVKVPNSCRCGFNQQRSKHCILGSGHPNYIKYITAKKKLLADPHYTKHCHTLERYSDNYCVEKLKIDRSVAFRQAVRDYNNLKISVLEYQRLINADECIKTIVFDYNTLPILPDKRKCAKFSCDDTLANCAEGNNPLNEEGDKVTMVLNEKLCKDNDICTMSDEKGIDFIYENYTLTGSCEKKGEKSRMRLPGEDCSQSSDCFQSKCGTNNKCEGKDLNEECLYHSQCKVGLYCSNKVCQRQKKEGEFCETSWACQNHLGCYANAGTSNNHCMAFGMVTDIDISLIHETWQKDPIYHKSYDPSEIGTDLMCKSGQSSVKKTRCGMYSYDTSVPLMKTMNKAGFVECQADENCHYIDNFNIKTTKKCECGYNADGKGYCPLPNSSNKEDWDKLNQHRRELTDNQCHTLSRFDCYLNAVTKEMKTLEMTTTKAHLFHDAVPCAYKVLSCNWIKYNWISALSIISLLLVIIT